MINYIENIKLINIRSDVNRRGVWSQTPQN